MRYSKFLISTLTASVAAASAYVIGVEVIGAGVTFLSTACASYFIMDRVISHYVKAEFDESEQHRTVERFLVSSLGSKILDKLSPETKDAMKTELNEALKNTLNNLNHGSTLLEKFESYFTNAITLNLPTETKELISKRVVNGVMPQYKKLIWEHIRLEIEAKFSIDDPIASESSTNQPSAQ